MNLRLMAEHDIGADQRVPLEEQLGEMVALREAARGAPPVGRNWEGAAHGEAE